MRALQFRTLAGIPGLLHAITTRALPREAVPGALGVARPVVTAVQVHEATIRSLDEAPDADPGRADGFCTSRVDGPLPAVMGADCPGVLLVAPRVRALAVLHAGWRGVVAGIVPAGLRLLQERYGASPEELLAGIGPGIGQDNYEVSDEVADAIAGSVPARARSEVLRAGRPGHAYADLRAAIRVQLGVHGLPAAAIETHTACTYDDERFFSYRRDGPQTGRHLLVAGWREG